MTLEVSSLSLSDLFINHNFVLTLHPQAADIDGESRALAQKAGIWVSGSEHYNSLASYMYCGGYTDQVTTISFLTDLMFYIDDLYDNRAARNISPADLQTFLARCFKAFSTGERSTPSSPVDDAAYELRQRFLRHCDPVWFSRFIDAVKSHFTNIMEDMSVNEQGRLTVEEYLRVREPDGCMLGYLYLIEFSHDQYLSEEVLNSAYIQRLNTIGIHIPTLANDLFSFEKEVLVGKSNFNFIPVIMEQDNLSFTEAVDATIEYLNKITLEFETLEAAQPDFGDATTNATVATYVQGIRDILSSTWYWQLATNRYRSPQSPFAELREMLPPETPVTAG